MSEEDKKAVEWFKEDLTKEKEEMRYYNEYKKQVIKRNEKLLNLIRKQQKEIEDLETKLEIEKIDNKYNQEERDEETIPRYKIREFIKEELPDDEIMKWSIIYDVNGIDLRKKLEELLEEQ